MESLPRVHEEGRSAGAGQGRGNLPADMAGLAHASHYHPGGAVQYALHRRLELIPNALFQSLDSSRFYLQGLYGFLRYHGHGCNSF